MHGMRRREFITLLGGSTLGWPLAAQAQQAKLRTVGFLGAAGPAVASHWLSAFEQRLHELGWNEGQNVVFEVRWAEGRRERATEIAAEFVRRKVDVIATWATMPALVAKQATSEIPIVFALATDPIGSGLVASLGRPGGNATGLSDLNVDIVGKRVELLREFVPRLERIAIIANVDVLDSAAELRAIQAVAQNFGIAVAPLEIRRGEDIAPRFRHPPGWCRSTFRGRRSPDLRSSRTDYRFCTERADANNVCHSRVCRGWRADVLRHEFPRPVSACRRVRRQSSARNESGRHPG